MGGPDHCTEVLVDKLFDLHHLSNYPDMEIIVLCGVGQTFLALLPPPHPHQEERSKGGRKIQHLAFYRHFPRKRTSRAVQEARGWDDLLAVTSSGS
jgi:hypothetical protein